MPTVTNADTLGIRPDLVGRPITGWADLTAPEFKGKSALHDNPTVGVIDVAMALEARGDLKYGNKGNMTKAEIDKTVQAMTEIKQSGQFPTLDLADFMGLSFGTFTDGKLYQLPDQQFANLYWFRYDLVQRPDIKAGFKKQFGYDLGVPVNWSAYEDIADDFTNTVKEVNGKPVDEWGIRMEDSLPRGSSITRGGDANGPAAVYALTKYVEWLKKYAPGSRRHGLPRSRASAGA